MEEHMAKILIVDDEIELLRSMTRFLKLFGHQVVTAENGKEGLCAFMVASGSFNVVISDCHMPGMDGFTMLEKIIETGFPADRCILMTGDLTEERIAQANALGISAYRKPFPLINIMALIDTSTKE